MSVRRVFTWTSPGNRILLNTGRDVIHHQRASVAPPEIRLLLAEIAPVSFENAREYLTNPEVI
jgi:hypothetical protein